MTKNKNSSYDVISRKLLLSLGKQFPTATEDALKDCIEDAFHDFFKTASEEAKNDEGQTYALLYAIAANNLKDYFTSPKKKRTSSLDKIHEDGFDFPSEDESKASDAKEAIDIYIYPNLAKVTKSLSGCGWRIFLSKKSQKLPA